MKVAHDRDRVPQRARRSLQEGEARPRHLAVQGRGHGHSKLEIHCRCARVELGFQDGNRAAEDVVGLVGSEPLNIASETKIKKKGRKEPTGNRPGIWRHKNVLSSKAGHETGGTSWRQFRASASVTGVYLQLTKYSCKRCVETSSDDAGE